MPVALTRDVSPAIARCELTHLKRQPIDYARAVAQHDAYCARLAELGMDVVRLPAEEALPDCCFVEDTALVMDEVAIIARPGAPARRPEVEAVAQALAGHRTLVRLEAPAQLDGGDVLVLGRRVFVGRSSRTNEEGLRALSAILQPCGYEVVPVSVRGCLHLKSAVSAVGPDLILANPDWADLSPLAEYERVEVDPGEPFAANALRAAGVVVVHAGFPRTRERLEARGLDVRTVDVSEFLKAEAGVTCKSLVFEGRS